MGTRGTVVERMSEAETAAKILGLDVRESLGLLDGSITENIENRRQLARMLRKLKPSFVVGPYYVDKHPDHEAAGRLIKSAVFDARLKKLDLELPPHSVRAVFYYPSHIYFTPSFVVDISGSFEQKMEAVRAYVSQFIRKDGVDKNFRPIGISDYLFQIESHNRHFGSLIGKKYGEGFLLEGMIEISDPHQLFGEPGGAGR
jgi:bacillithiol biosynthesis deacetylase BshB1